jgi:hypothetical protein
MKSDQEYRLLISKVEHLGYADTAEFWIWRIKDNFFPYRFFCLTTPRKDESTIFGVYPQGKFPIAIAHMFTHNVDHYELSGVAGHTGLFIHSGNTVADTRNCILVGEKLELPDVNGQYRLYNSQAAIRIIEDTLQKLPSEIWIYP